MRFALVLSLVALAAVSLSQGPPPTNSAAGQTQQRQPERDQRKANGSKPNAGALDAPQTGKVKSKTDDGDSDSSPNWWIVGSAVVSALATAGYLIVTIIQSGHMRRNLELTKQAANAATKAADTAESALTKTERAYVTLRHLDFAYVEDAKGRGGEPLMLARLCLFNSGRTVALIKGVEVLVRTGVLPSQPEWHGSHVHLCGSMPVPSNGEMRFNTMIVAPPDATEALLAKKWVASWGRIYYDDVVGVSRETGFAIEYNHEPSAWHDRMEFVQQPGYNYCT